MIKTRTIAQTEIPEKWYLLDATGMRIGRVASCAAQLLMGKNQPLTRSYLMPQTKVVIVNAEKLDIAPRRLQGKVYTAYSGYPGGLTVQTLDEVITKHPERVLEHAIKGMLPRSRRGQQIHATNLYVYAGEKHEQEAQQPEKVDIKALKL